MLSKEKIGEIVLGWCKEEGIFREEAKETDAAFHYKVNVPGNTSFSMSIIQPVGADKVFVTSGVRLEPEFIAAMRGIGEQKRTEFIAYLSYNLYSQPTIFHIQESDGVIRQVTITDQVYSDELTKGRFMRAIQDVYRVTALAFLQIQGFLATIPLERGAGKAAPQEAGTPGAQGKLETCSQCGAKLAEGAKFCTKCGTPVQPAASVEVKPPAEVRINRCPKCGAEAKGGGKFCTKCGAPLK